MDTQNPVANLCIQITQAEFAGRLDEARDLARQAWELASDDYEACMAAHYVARFEPTPAGQLHWNQEALVRAGRAGDERVADFYPSLYVNLGRSYELLGNHPEALRYYKKSGIER